MKKKTLVYVVLYNNDVLCVCRSRAIARLICKRHVLELNYFVDRFDIKELPLL